MCYVVALETCSCETCCVEHIYILKQFRVLCRCSMQLVRCSVVGGFWEHFCKAWNCGMLNSCSTVGNVYSCEKNKQTFIFEHDIATWCKLLETLKHETCYVECSSKHTTTQKHQWQAPVPKWLCETNVIYLNSCTNFWRCTIEHIFIYTIWNLKTGRMSQNMCMCNNSVYIFLLYDALTYGF